MPRNSCGPAAQTTDIRCQTARLPSRLCRTKAVPLARYSNFSMPAEFSKLVALMKNLAPSLIVLVHPTSEQGIRPGQWDAVRENLLLVLESDPATTSLF
jgi:hypothetical protein